MTLSVKHVIWANTRSLQMIKYPDIIGILSKAFVTGLFCDNVRSKY
jgi:hypothetical protein